MRHNIFHQRSRWLAVGLLPLVISHLALGLFAGEGEWPMYRHDRRLTGRNDGSGEFASPKVVWKQDLRGYKWFIEIEPSSENAKLTLSVNASAGAAISGSDAIGRLQTPRVDLAGDGVLRPAPAYAAKILRDRPGLQTFAVQKAGDEQGFCELYAHDGDRQRLWRSDDFSVFLGPHPVVADANDDGQLDVIVCPHYLVAVLDGRTGRTIQQLRWHDGRNYGHFVVKNIDEDPALEMCVLADFYSHLVVIDNDGENLNLLWNKEIELRVENKAKIVRPRWDPLQDLDGDGRFEIALSLYNETGDRRWHTVIYDALTGQVRCDRPDSIIEGLEDVDGDGTVELFCTRSQALFVPASSRLSLLSYRGGELAERWSHADGAWVTAAHRFPLFINSTVAGGNHNVVVGKFGTDRREFYIQSPPSSKSGPLLQAFRVSGEGSIELSWSCRAAHGAERFSMATWQPSSESPRSRLMSLHTSVSGAEVSFRGARGTVRGVERTAPEMQENWKGGYLIAARLGSDPHCSIAAVAGNRDVVFLNAGSGNKPEIRWRGDGGGPLLAADFDGDGTSEIAMLGEAPSGKGRVSLRNGDGTVRWSVDLDRFPGPFRPWNRSALTGLSCGRFTEPDHDDLIVFTRRSTMQSDEGHCLSGRDGSLLWKQTTSFDGTRNWGFGGNPIASDDHDGDGTDDLYSLYPVNYTVSRGRDGRQLIGRSSAGEDILPGMWAAYATPTLFDFDGDRSPELVWAGPYCLGITDVAGKTRWGINPRTEFPHSLRGAYPVDWQGDGNFALLAVTQGMLYSFDPATGGRQWKFSLPAADKALIGDLDGDGRDEAALICGERISGVSVENGRAKTDWTVRLPDECVDAILADTDGDRKLELLVLTGAGLLLAIE
jgi:outer membrane protein assembly factor BamB